jgi:uncharacterized protein YndB with AHSA1/START domain
MQRGTYLELDGRPAVRFERTYDHPVERVWAAVSEPDGLAHWFPSRVRFERRAGGRIEFSGDPNAGEATGTVLAYDPPRAFAFTWGGDEVHLDLEPLGGGGCRLTLTNVLEARDAAARNAAGWAVCLDALGADLAGGGAPGQSGDGWREHYDAYVASGMPSGAPVPGGG